MKQNGLFDPPPEPKRPYHELQVQPNPELVAAGHFITQHVGSSCAYCGEPLEIEEKLHGTASVTVARQNPEDHYQDCDAYKAARVTVDDADGHLPTGKDVRAVAPRPRKKAA